MALANLSRGPIFTSEADCQRGLPMGTNTGSNETFTIHY